MLVDGELEISIGRFTVCLVRGMWRDKVWLDCCGLSLSCGSQIIGVVALVWTLWRKVSVFDTSRSTFAHTVSTVYIKYP